MMIHAALYTAALPMIKASSTHWPSIAALWLCGVLGAMQFSKVSMAFAALQTHYGVSAASMGWSLSTVGLVGLVGGVTMGLFGPTIGFKRLLLLGMGTGTILALVQALMLPYPVFFVTRVLEGASHLAIVVAAPTLMAGVSSARHRSVAMGIWSTFFGAAFALTAALGPMVLTQFDVSALFLLHGAGLGLMGCLAYLIVPRDSAKSERALPPRALELLALHRQIYTHWRTALPGLCFWCYTLMVVALLTFIPPLTGSNQAWIATVLPLAGVCGTFCAGWLAQYWLSPLQLMKTGFVTVGFSAIALSGALHLGVGVTPLALLLMLTAGLSGGSAFALIPHLNTNSLHQARANGAVAQMGNLGATLGPPSFALALSLAGGLGLMAAALLCAVAGFSLALWGSNQMDQSASQGHNL